MLRISLYYIVWSLLERSPIAYLFDPYSDGKVLNTASVGKFQINWDSVDPYIQITHEDDPERFLFRSLPSWPFVTVGYATDSKPPIVDGNFKVNEWTLFETPHQSIKKVALGESNFTISGDLWGLVTKATYEMTFYVDTQSNQLQFKLHATPIHGSFNRIFLNYWCDPKENFYGFGVQYTHWNLKGQRVPILVAEQGIGRGAEPTTTALNLMADGTGGDPLTTYAPKPLYITNYNRSMIFENSQMMYFDLRDDDAVVVEIWGKELYGRILYGNSMLNIISEITLVTGRMKAVPAWTQNGAIIGLEGGTKEVIDHVNHLIAHNVPMAGIWIQDWVGLRHAYDGDRLLWNWRLDSEYYPQWYDMIQSWANHNIRVLTYINPFFSEINHDIMVEAHGLTIEMKAHKIIPQRNLYREGINNHYFVHNKYGTPYILRSGSIEFCMLDTTNPEARQWMKDIIKYEMIYKSSSSGWMADFGEYLPFDSVLFDGSLGGDYHNIYPQEWARINEEAIREAQAENIHQQVTYSNPTTATTTIQENHDDDDDDDDDDDEPISDIVYYMRSAWLNSPNYTSLFWLGDQMVTWDKYDGIKTVLTGALSGGLGGHSMTHSDIGGYTMQEIGPFPNIRTRELLYRWIELEAFGSIVFRTHIGSSVSQNNAQIYQDKETMAYFSRFTNIFIQLASYRKKLMKEATKKGWPLIRSMAAHYANDPISWTLQSQYMFGDEFMIAPVLDSVHSTTSSGSKNGKNRHDLTYADTPVRGLKVYIPAYSTWIHLWTGQEVSGGNHGRYVTVDAPFGHPPVFYTPSSVYGQNLRQYIINNHYDAEFISNTVSTPVDSTATTNTPTTTPTTTTTVSDIIPTATLYNNKVDYDTVSLYNEPHQYDYSYTCKQAPSLFDTTRTTNHNLSLSSPTTSSTTSASNTDCTTPIYTQAIDSTTTTTTSSSSSTRIYKAKIGIIQDYHEPTWLDWLGLSEYSAVWDSNQYHPELDPYHHLYHKNTHRNTDKTSSPTNSLIESSSTISSSSSSSSSYTCAITSHQQNQYHHHHHPDNDLIDDIMNTITDVATAVVISALSVDMDESSSSFHS